MALSINNLTYEDIGKEVIYIPTHANGDTRHKDCQLGVISSWNDSFIFIKYYLPSGELNTTAHATESMSLIFN